MPLFIGKDAENCEEWFLELISLRFPDIRFFGSGRKYVARMDRYGQISVQMCRSMADYRDAQRPGFGVGEIIHSGLELTLQEPVHWHERRKRGVVTPSAIRDCQTTLTHLQRLLGVIREQGFVSDEECTCNFEEKRQAAFAEMERDLERAEDPDFDSDVDPLLLTEEKDLWVHHGFECPVHIQGAIDEALSK